MTKTVAALLFILIVGGCAVMMVASPPAGVKPTIIARGTYDAFRVRSDSALHGLLEFNAKAKTPIDMVVRTHEYAPGSSTGWHTHPGPVFITVVQGQVTFYEADDPMCTPKVVCAGQGYVDTGRGHIGRNETGLPAKDVTVIIAPVDLPFRDELPAPGPYCIF
jgi:hypothetical protein